MTYNFSSYQRMGSCIPVRTAYMTDPRYHNQFDPRHVELDLNIPSCPACPPVPACPACPPCPPYLQPKLESKNPIDFSKLSTRINMKTDDILDAITEKPTGMKVQECIKIIENTKNDLEIRDGKLVGKCENSSECDRCVEAINSSVVSSTKSAEPVPNMSIPEGAVDVI